MKTFSVKIPDDKTSFFREFLELIGGSFDKQEFELTAEMKQVLDERLKTDKSEYLPARESIDKIKSKYGFMN